MPQEKARTGGLWKRGLGSYGSAIRSTMATLMKSALAFKVARRRQISAEDRTGQHSGELNTGVSRASKRRILFSAPSAAVIASERRAKLIRS